MQFFCMRQGRYDIMFLLEELQRRAIRPKKIVSAGMRIFQLVLGGRHQREVVFKDSLNFFGAPLAALPAVFGLDVDEKPFFPYMYIRTENLHVELDGLPPRELYEPDRMRPAQRSHFLQWYLQEQQQVFRLDQKLLEYCANDVTILRMASLRYRQLVGQHSAGMDPFEAASTSAGLAMAIFRQCHLLPDRIVHSPEGGYRRGRLASAESRRFFYVLERVWQDAGCPWRIQTAEWAIGEAQPDDCGYRLDGFVRRAPPQRSLAIEYNGCYVHGQ